MYAEIEEYSECSAGSSKLSAPFRRKAPGRIELAPRSPFAGLEIGESIAVNGVCLTVASVSSGAFEADVMPETLQRTTLGELTAGAIVNLERALRFGDRVGGHMVSGHIDATGIVTALREDGNARWVTIATPERPDRPHR